MILLTDDGWRPLKRQKKIFYMLLDIQREHWRQQDIRSLGLMLLC